MKHTIASLKLISGSVDADKLIASQFCREALDEVQARVDAIENLCDLAMILDTSGFAEATSALAGIRHITAAVEGVAEFHSKGGLGAVFSDLHKRLANSRAKAESRYQWLASLMPSTASPAAVTN